MPWQRDRIRTCLRCHETWRVPYHLAKQPRASKWGRGVSMPDRNMYMGRGAMFDAALRYQLDEAARRGSTLDRDLALTAELSRCRRCGSEAWSERRG